MESLSNDAKMRKYSVPINRFLSAYGAFESYLEKKARNIFAGWQKRYFRILEGKILIYTESKESKQLKGFIQIKKIVYIKSIDSKSFAFEEGGRQYLLKAESEELKKKWIEAIKYLMDLLSKRMSKDMTSSFDFNKSVDNIHKNKKSKDEKIKTINKKTAELIKKYGYIINKEDPLSNLLLEKKGINKLLNLNDPKVLLRIHYGFIHQKNNHDSFNKRWFFIFSPRPLLNDYYSNDDYDLEQKKQKDWIKFDVLYYFKFSKDEINSGYEGEIEMVECFKIINFEKEGKFFMNLDVGEKTYNFYCENKSERDEWFEVLKNSRKTAKEYKLSITKHPRNIDLLSTLFLKDKKEFNKTIEKEKNSIIGNVKEIYEYNIFEFTINNLQFLIESTVDGCLCSNTNKIDLLKSYTEMMNKEYLNIFKIYWENNFDKLSNEDLLKMSYKLLNYFDCMNKLNVDDENILKNGKELTKIYFKKIFQIILKTIENILKSERELKGNKNEEGIYYTCGPKDLFDILSNILDLVKDYKHPVIYKELLKILNVLVFQYLIGVNCVISNQDIIIENEYLISVANNNLNMIQFLNSLIESVKNLGVLNEKDINEEIQFKKIMSSINKLSFGSIVRFVYEQKDELNKYFEKKNYFDINMEEIILKSGEIFGKYKSMMVFPVIKKCWNEILKLTLCYYITSLLLTARKKKKSKEDILSKIKNDKNILSESYSGIVGENLTNSTLKILDDIINFLEVSQYMISSSCLALREYIGPAFAYSAAKKFVKLRSDFSKDEIKDCKAQCEDVLNNYVGPKNEDSSYFIILSKKIKKNDKDKKFKKSLKIKFGNSFVENSDENKESSSDSDIEEDKSLKKKISIEYNVQNLDSFLKDFEEEENEQEDDLYEEKEEFPKDEIFIEDEDEEEGEIIDDIDKNIEIEYEGFCHKKSNSSYKQYYFQIKNGFIYLFKDKNSKIAKDKISLKNVNKVDTTEENKFVIKINAKNDVKEYKFKCESEEDKLLWVRAITRAMGKIKKDNEVQIKEKIEIKERKKIISDLSHLPNIKFDGIYIKDQVLDSLYGEDFFKMTPKKIEIIKRKSTRKIRKEKKEKEIEKKKIKEEKKRIKEDKKREKEKSKDKEKDGNKNTIGNKIENWFKSDKKKDKINDEENGNEDMKE